MFVFLNPCARAELHQRKRARKLCSATLSAGCQLVPGKAPIFYAAKVSFRVPRRNTELCDEKQNSNFLFNLFCLPHCLCDLASVAFDDIMMIM